MIGYGQSSRALSNPGWDTKAIFRSRRPGDAQGEKKTVQRTPVSNPVKENAPVRTVFVLVVMLLAISQARAGGPAAPGAVVQGVVKDAQGVAQMGALVQVLAANSSTVGTTFTDLHGHYVIANLLPGKYRVRASATLFVPATRENLQLKNGGRTVVNLTLAMLFETSSWLPADRRKADEPADDWKWTLRSTANRPILRVLDDGETVLLSSGDAEGPGQKRAIQARATVACTEGGYGDNGTRTTVEANRDLSGGMNLLMQAQMGSAHDGGRAPATMVATGFQRSNGFGVSRTIVRYQSHPELVGNGSTGVQTLDIRSAQQTQLGDQVELEVGGRLRAVHLDGDAFQAAPFVRLTAHPSGTWMVQYRMASSRELQGIADLDGAEDDIPVAIVTNGKLRLEQGRHQQISVAHRMGRGSVEVAVYQDSMSNPAVAGGSLSEPGAVASSVMGAASPLVGAMMDSVSGNFRALATGYRADGASVRVDGAVMPGVMGAVEYTMGSALSGSTATSGSIADAVAALKPHAAQAATVALRGHIGDTKMRVSYRWQPLRTVTAVDPYGDLAEQGYLSFTVRQPIRWAGHLPPGLNATIDVTNLLAQGYRPFVSADGQTLYFAQAPRTMQAGLSFSF
jgi:hypothetical protein